jgi:PAS domain-containing protein
MFIAFVGVLTALIGGGGVWVWLNGRADRADKREESEIGRLRKDVDDLRARDDQCQEKLRAMDQRVEAMEQAQECHIARWVKDARMRVMWVNPKAMLTIFGPLGYTRDDLEGKTFAELDKLDHVAVGEIARLDQVALARDGAPVSSMIRFHPLLPEMHIVKITAAARDGGLIYEGYAYRRNDAEVSEGIAAARQIEAIEASADHLMPRG